MKKELIKETKPISKTYNKLLYNDIIVYNKNNYLINILYKYNNNTLEATITNDKNDVTIKMKSRIHIPLKSKTIDHYYTKNNSYHEFSISKKILFFLDLENKIIL